MGLNLSMPEHEDLKPRITVFGVGGAGGNAVNNMIEKQLDGVEFVVANTDAQALQQSRAGTRVQLGTKVTEGLGAGARPAVGAAAAEESIEQIIDHLAGSHMCFITAGMGGGTGTGATPIIAQAARELGVLTVGVVTKPFQFEGAKRMKQAEEGVENLQKMVDTLIIIPNQNLFRLANEKTTFTEAFSMADDVLYQGVKGVTDLMVRPGLINLDFADVRAVMDEMGKAMMGTGEGTGEDRAVQAAEKAIANPLLDEISLKGARGVLINITGGHDLTLFELDEAANRIRQEVDPEANIIVGSTLDPDMAGEMRVSVVATGIEATRDDIEIPTPRRSNAEAVAQQVVQPAQPAEPVQDSAPQRTLFDDEASDVVTADVEDDDLPAPAYTPERSEDSFDPFETELSEELEAQQKAEDAAAARVQEVQPQPQLQPQRSAPGTPSQETLDRLYRAAAKKPSSTPASRPTPMAAERREPEPQANVDRPRFGINSLINRMTGHQDDRGRSEPRMGRHDGGAPQPEVSRDRQRLDDPNEERVEIPAFLRRQAN